MTVRIPIVDRRSSRTPDDAGTPVALAEPPAGLNEEAVAQSQSRPPTPAPSAPPPVMEPAAGRLEALAAERDEWRERCLRAAAESENLRRVADQRVENEVFRRERDRLERWLDVGDALDRARAHAAGAPPEWRTGLDEVARVFDELMAKSGAKRLEAAETFDPAFHEALATRPEAGRADGSIAEVCRAGWMLGERLLRPAGVVVVRNAAK
jgi:molecular chaperone GrpE